jgi:hypothetical protein
MLDKLAKRCRDNLRPGSVQVQAVQGKVQAALTGSAVHLRVGAQGQRIGDDTERVSRQVVGEA